MYNSLKRITAGLIPRKLLYKSEPVLRSIYYRLYYQGTAYDCNICEKGLNSFIKLPNGNLICPNCGSSGRDRRLWDILCHKCLGNNYKHLDFSPSRSLYRALKNTENHQHIATDISGDFLADEQFDITNIEAEDGTFDLITCYHVLEHIPDDLAAMGELFRVMDEGGTCFIQTPFKDGEVYEDPTITSPRQRHKHFGQHDHVRIYSSAGLKDRLQSVGFKVEVLRFYEESDNPNGFMMNETVLKCRK